MSDMSSLDVAANPSMRRDETLEIARLVAFAAVGTNATKVIPNIALGLPALTLLTVLFRCERRHSRECP